MDLGGAARRVSDSEALGTDILGRLGQQRPMESDRKPRKWKKGVRLGSGAFGQVFVAYNEETGEEVAVKQVDLHPESGRENLRVSVITVITWIFFLSFFLLVRCADM